MSTSQFSLWVATKSFNFRHIFNTLRTRKQTISSDNVCSLCHFQKNQKVRECVIIYRYAKDLSTYLAYLLTFIAYRVLFCILYWRVWDRRTLMNGTTVPLRNFFYRIPSASLSPSRNTRKANNEEEIYGVNIKSCTTWRWNNYSRQEKADRQPVALSTSLPNFRRLRLRHKIEWSMKENQLCKIYKFYRLRYCFLYHKIEYVT